MNCIRTLVVLMGILLSATTWALAPLPVTEDTVALWNFDTDTGDTVPDLATNPIDGTAYMTVREAIPGIDVSFKEARRFTGTSSFVDVGVVTGSKLDLTGMQEFAIEAVISITGNTTGDHSIVNFENVRLLIQDGKLAGYIRQRGGLYGLVSDMVLPKNTSTRVALIYVGNQLGLFINDRSEGFVLMNDPIQAPLYSTVHAFLGGDLYGKYFPGYIDDVRVSDKKMHDTDAPTITLVQPSSFVVNELKPLFDIQYADADSGIDAADVEVYLNGVLQTAIPRTSSAITGQMDQNFKPGILNDVRVVVVDRVGNMTEKHFLFSFANVLGRTEYTTDEFTLGLWHMNDASPVFMQDDSGNARHGFGDFAYHSMGDGVFGDARYFMGQSKIGMASIQIPNEQLTFETWIRPTAPEGSADETIFSTGQIKIIRYNGGHVRVAFTTVRRTETFESTMAILPPGELHHFAVTWDGSAASDNLKFYIDGAIVQAYDACTQCDLSPMPVAGAVGQNFTGMLDEMRLSSIVREGFNIPTLESHVIQFLSLQQGTSVNVPRPEIHIAIQSPAVINPASMRLTINGVTEPASALLNMSATAIDGLPAHDLKIGLNTIELTYTDTLGNQKRKSQSFFYIRSKDEGLEYRADADTAGLWHVNETSGIVMADASGQNHVLTSTQALIEGGVIGNARKGTLSHSETDIALNSRSWTIEGMLKRGSATESFYQLFDVQAADYRFYSQMNPSNGNIRVYFSTPEWTLDQVVPNAFPMNDEFHHVALVFDGTRSYSQLLLVIDGDVKKTFTVKSNCYFRAGALLYVGEGSFVFDEIRLSRVPRYELNWKNGLGRPVIQILSPLLNQTVATSSTPVSISLGDSSGLQASGSYLVVNGARVSLDFNASGATATLTGTIPLIPGANLLEAHALDATGLEQVQSSLIYSIVKGTGEYSSDEDTLLLYHFNETSGTTLADDSGNGCHLNTQGAWTLGKPGVFSSTGVSSWSSTLPLACDGLAKLNRYTIETWFYPDYNTYLSNFFSVSGFGVSLGNGRLALAHPNFSVYYSPTVLTQDARYHHIAWIVDANHPYRQMYFVFDGKVVSSEGFSQVDRAKLALPNSNQAYFGETLYNNFIDEFRFSKTARYTLNYSATK